MNLQNRFAALKKFRAEDFFYLIFSLSVFARVICDINLNRIGIHEGVVFPVRKLHPEVAPYSVSLLFFEWGLAFIGGCLLNLKKIRFGALLIVVSSLMSLSQMFQNQKILILIIALVLLISPLSRKDFWSTWFLRYQLVLLYSISALQKLSAEFLNGNALKATFDYTLTVENNPFIRELILFFSQDFFISLFSYATFALEISLPILLIKKPRLGVPLVFLLHFSFNLLMKDILPFSLAALSLSVLFLIEPDERESSLHLQQHSSILS